jgi:REP element-mobilizing transposase RayT
MARGNRLDPIFVAPKGKDQELFLKTLAQACERTGFHVWAWVLMKNHYHLVLETPKANLVSGMSWLQNTYTRRFNARHKKWGRLFGDRYKSILIEEERSGGGSSYLATLLDYVHLNPARAGLIAAENPKANSVLDYPWSSIARGYALPPKHRPKWLAADAGMELFGLKDNAKSRRRFVERLDGRMMSEEAERCGVAEIDGQTLNSSLRRGWYWGSEEFKESLLLRLDSMAAEKQKEGLDLPSGFEYVSGQQFRDHDLAHAEAIVARAVEHFGIAMDERSTLPKLPRGDWTLVAIAWAICRNTSVPQHWVAQRLHLKSAGNVSERVRRFEQLKASELPLELRRWRSFDF